MPTHHGFKRITVENWLEPDVPIIFPEVTEAVWVKAHLVPALNSRVPDEVAALFEVARSSMIYGWFFYPLITLGAEQLQRVLETAARLRCDQAGVPTKKTTKKGKQLETKFVENLAALAAKGLIAPDDLPRWEATRRLRNMSSHPESQTILPPAVTLSSLETAAELLNRFYA